MSGFVSEHATLKGSATRSKNFNGIVSMTPYIRQTIATIAFVNELVPGRRAELFRLVALSRYNLMVTPASKLFSDYGFNISTCI